MASPAVPVPCPSCSGSFYLLGRPGPPLLLQLPEVPRAMPFLSLCLLPCRACQVRCPPVHSASVHGHPSSQDLGAALPTMPPDPLSRRCFPKSCRGDEAADRLFPQHCLCFLVGHRGVPSCRTRGPQLRWDSGERRGSWRAEGPAPKHSDPLHFSLFSIWEKYI